MLVIGYWKPRASAYEMNDSQVVNIEPWKHAKLFSALILIFMAAVYAVFSPIGLAEAPSGFYSPWAVVFLAAVLLFIGAIALFWRHMNKKFDSETMQKRNRSAWGKTQEKRYGS